MSTDISSSSSAVSPIASPLTASSSESFLQSASDVSLNSMQVSLPSQTGLNTFKLVSDNINKEVQPHEMRSDYQSRSLHYFHTYAVKDRVDLSGISNILPVIDLTKVQLSSILPSANEYQELCNNFAYNYCFMIHVILIDGGM